MQEIKEISKSLGLEEKLLEEALDCIFKGDHKTFERHISGFNSLLSESEKEGKQIFLKDSDGNFIAAKYFAAFSSYVGKKKDTDRFYKELYSLLNNAPFERARALADDALSDTSKYLLKDKQITSLNNLRSVIDMFPSESHGTIHKIAKDYFAGDISWLSDEFMEHKIIVSLVRPSNEKPPFDLATASKRLAGFVSSIEADLKNLPKYIQRYIGGQLEMIDYESKDLKVGRISGINFDEGTMTVSFDWVLRSLSYPHLGPFENSDNALFLINQNMCYSYVKESKLIYDCKTLGQMAVFHHKRKKPVKSYMMP